MSRVQNMKKADDLPCRVALAPGVACLLSKWLTFRT